MATGEIVGREAELARLHTFLDGAEREPRALLLEGEAGAGKSTLWAAGIAAAQERGLRVLSSRPAEAERGFPYVVLADLLEGVVEEVLPALPAARRYALEGALLLEHAPEEAVDPRTLGVAVRTSIEVLAAEQPLVLAVDDVQWVDSSSAGALAFALRRLSAEHVVLLLARRVGEPVEGPAIEDTLDADAVERLPVGPLSLGAMRLLLHRRLGRTFARPTLLRLHEVSGGNAFYALELARGLGPKDASGDALEPLPVPQALERLVSARLAGFADPTREALLLTATHGRPSPALFGAAGSDQHALEPAFRANVVELADGLVRFTHPLLASVLYQEATEEQRRAAHARLAVVVDDPVDRARHLALATDSADEEIAVVLEEAATRARARGTLAAAVELAEHALRLTPPDAPEHRQRRALAAARVQLEAGDARRARTLGLMLLAGARAGARAEALVLLSDLEWATSLERAIALRREALDAAAGLPALRAEIHEWLGAMVYDTEGAHAAEQHAEAAFELAEALDDDSVRAGALSRLAFIRFRAGDPEAPRLVEQARLAAAAADPRRRRIASWGVVYVCIWSYQLDRARALLASIEREWSERGELTTADVLGWFALTELRAGRFPLAADYAKRAMDILRQYASEEREEPRMYRWLAALLAAHRGDLDHARARLQSDPPLTERPPLVRVTDGAVLGLVELWSGRPDEAVARFAAAEQERRGLGIEEPAMAFWRGDYAEALLALDRHDEAAALVAAWEAKAARLGREEVLAQAARCRGLLAAARGEHEEARAELERAVAQHEAAGDPFGRARALLALGIVRRRARQRRAAREALESALQGFEACGAAGWAAKARAELGRIGGRTRSSGLTPAEERIAALAAAGRTNREVAADLVLTEHTVEVTLTRVYRKLGVRSRTELANRLVRETQEPRASKS